MKKLFALLLAMTMLFSLGMLSAQAEDAEEDLPYQPKEDYDEYTVVDYEIVSMGEELEIVVCKRVGDKEYNLQFFFFGGDADVDVTYDENGKATVTNDGGFFQTEGPLVVAQAEEEGNWKKIGDNGAETEDTTEEELPYDPKEEYDEYTVVDYEIVSMGEELEIVVCKRVGDKEYNLQFYFFGGDADVDVTYDEDGKATVTNDGGFFQTEGPLVVAQAEEEGNWKKVADYKKSAAIDLSELPYQPKEDYDEFTVVDYEIVSMGEELEIVVCKRAGDKEYNLQFFFFGGDADVDVTYDEAGKATVTNDGGFFQTEGPLVVEQAEAESNWVKIG